MNEEWIKYFEEYLSNGSLNGNWVEDCKDAFIVGWETALKARWKPIDTAPKDGRAVLVFYKNELDKNRIVKVRYVGKFMLECDDDTYQVDYDENDIPYCPEGWYEQVDNYDDYAEFYMERNITHWTPLPSPPIQG